MSSDNTKLPQVAENMQATSVPMFEEVYQSYTENSDYNIKYSSGSSVYTTQSIENPDSNELIYVISSIIQSEMCEHLTASWKYAVPPYSNLHINTHLPAHLGGLLPNIPESLLQKEAGHDPELWEYLINYQVPTVDTILRFITWIHQSAKFSAPCNIIAFIYIKRIISTKRLLNMNNWRGLWVGCVMIAQKFWDDTALRCSAFTTILPGVSSSELQSIEICIFDLLEHSVRVKPSMYAKFYFELRAIFQSMVGSTAANFSVTTDGSVARPLSRVQGAMLLLQQQNSFTTTTIATSSACSILSVASGDERSPRARPLSTSSSRGVPMVAGSDQSVSQSSHSQSVASLPSITSVSQSVTSLPSITSVSGRPLSQSHPQSLTQMHSQFHPQSQSEVSHDPDSRAHYPHRTDSAGSMHSTSTTSHTGMQYHPSLSRGGPHNSSVSTLSSSSGAGLSVASMESVGTGSGLGRSNSSHSNHGDWVVPTTASATTTNATTATTSVATTNGAAVVEGTEHYGYGIKLPEIVRVSVTRRSATNSEAGGNSGTISSHTATTSTATSSTATAGRHAMTVEDVSGIPARSIFVIN